MAEPDLIAPAEALPAYVAQTLHTTGMFWFAFNTITAEDGDLGAFDSGDGVFMGAAFGRESVKQFFEVSYEESKGHDIYGDTTGVVPNPEGLVATAIHRRLNLGVRRYLRPVTGQSGRMVPFMVVGLGYHTMDVYGGGDLSPVNSVVESQIDDASGMGIYGGTGIEVYVSSQLTLGFDVRMAYWSWEGRPEATGDCGTASSSAGIYYHF
jgi:hypothetical protein